MFSENVNLFVPAKLAARRSARVGDSREARQSCANRHGAVNVPSQLFLNPLGIEGDTTKRGPQILP
jgi:hypothetical protein